MKILIYFLLFITAANCGGNQPATTETAPPPTQTPETAEVQDEVLVGSLTKEDLLQPPHASWFEPMYKSYNPDDKALQTIKENINDYKIKVFMGTWCADSQFEIPKFYKLLELSDFDMDNLEVTGVREDKTLPNDAQKEYDITYVPTIIFFKDGKEVNRFVEYAQEDLEHDIAKIVSGQEYTPAYE